MATIDTIRGIVPAYETMLRAAGIDSTEALLAAGRDRAGRQSLSAQTGIGVRLIFDWVKQADLLRIEGMDADHLELLADLGIETVPQLGARGPDRLREQCIDLRDPDDNDGATPSMTELARWVSQARTLDPAIVL